MMSGAARKQGSLTESNDPRILRGVLRLRKPPLSFVCFLLAVVAIGAATRYFIDALGLAAFFFFVASIDGKPAWKFWFDPVKRENGRTTTARAASQWAQRAVPNKRLGERP
jgi:hypothetical protein